MDTAVLVSVMDVSQVNSNPIIFVENKEIYEHYLQSKTLIGLKRIWVEGGDPS